MLKKPSPTAMFSRPGMACATAGRLYGYFEIHQSLVWHNRTSYKQLFFSQRAARLRRDQRLKNIDVAEV